MFGQSPSTYNVELRQEGKQEIRVFLVSAFGQAEAIAKARNAIRREGNQAHHDVLVVFKKQGRER